MTIRLLTGVLLLIAVGCGDRDALTMATAPLANLESCEDDPLQPGCEEPPPPPPPPSTSSLPSWMPYWLGPVVNVPYEAAGAPVPSDSGIWLGTSVTPANCFGTLATTPIMDHDQDYLADHCETELAKGFAPTLKFDPGDNECSRGEPWYGAKYFLNGRVRLAYLPAYYEDCGWTELGPYTSSHHGDNEYIMVEVEYDAVKQRWVMRHMFLSAHWGHSAGDQSEWVRAADSQWGFKPLGYPVVWVSKWKHGNFKSKFTCETLQDDCSSFSTLLRFPILPNRNVGSRTINPSCVQSEIRSPESTRAECFFIAREFRGWYSGSEGGSAGKYSDYLMDVAFEKWCPVGYSDSRWKPLCSSSTWGPSPDNPPPGSATATISGPGYSYETPFTLGVSLSQAVPPTGVRYEWFQRRCNTIYPETCDLPFGQVIETTTPALPGYLTRNDYYIKYFVRVFIGTGGTAFAQSPEFTVWGAGEYPPPECDPGEHFCLDELRAAPEPMAGPTRKPPRAVRRSRGVM